jgi:hypothetical protein
MEIYFDLIGDKIPNKRLEIHLEPTAKQDIWKEYCHDIHHILLDDIGLSYSAFVRLWNDHYPHVKIRQFKAVCGKCKTCAILSDLRKKARTAAHRQYVSDLHALHRSCYMRERKIYYAKQLKACQHPLQFMSIIADGMQQTHTQLPWCANVAGFSNSLSHHLQGILEHGQCMVNILFHFILTISRPLPFLLRYIEYLSHFPQREYGS